MHPILLLLPLALAAAEAPPITLDEALATAAKSNVDLKISGTDRALAGVDEYASWAGVLPRLDLGAYFGEALIRNHGGRWGWATMGGRRVFALRTNSGFTAFPVRMARKILKSEEPGTLVTLYRSLSR